MMELPPEALDKVSSGSLVFGLFVVWKIIEESFRYRGTQIHKRAVEAVAGSGNCKLDKEYECTWSNDDHKWLMDLRDYTIELRFEQSILRKTNQEMAQNIAALSKEISILNNVIQALAKEVDRETKLLNNGRNN